MGCCKLWPSYKYFSKIDKLQKIAVRFGFLKEATSILSLLEALDNKFWKNITNSAEGPLADLLPPSKRLNTVLLIGVFFILSNCQL